MARRRLIRSTSLPYHLYGRSNNREWFYLPPQEVWNVFVGQLNWVIEKWGLQVHAFVLMSNHYHILASAPAIGIDAVMCRLLKGVSDEINSRADRINHVFGGPYKWTLIDNWFQYHHVFRYIYQNPVRQGIVTRVSDYRFSTAGGFLLDRPYEVHLSSHPFEKSLSLNLARKGIYRWCDWLDEPYDAEHVEVLRKALYRRKFVFGRVRRTREIPIQFREDESQK